MAKRNKRFPKASGFTDESEVTVDSLQKAERDRIMAIHAALDREAGHSPEECVNMTRQEFQNMCAVNAQMASHDGFAQGTDLTMHLFYAAAAYVLNGRGCEDEWIIDTLVEIDRLLATYYDVGTALEDLNKKTGLRFLYSYDGILEPRIVADNLAKDKS